MTVGAVLTSSSGRHASMSTARPTESSPPTAIEMCSALSASEREEVGIDSASQLLPAW